MYLSTNKEMKENWPKNGHGENLELKDVMDGIIGKELNTQLSEYYDGWDVGMGKHAGEQSWFFVNVPEDLTTQILSTFNTINPTYLYIK